MQRQPYTIRIRPAFGGGGWKHLCSVVHSSHWHNPWMCQLQCHRGQHTHDCLTATAQTRSPIHTRVSTPVHPVTTTHVPTATPSTPHVLSGLIAGGNHDIPDRGERAALVSLFCRSSVGGMCVAKKEEEEKQTPFIEPPL